MICSRSLRLLGRAFPTLLVFGFGLVAGCGGSENTMVVGDAGIPAPVIIDPATNAFAPTLVNQSSDAKAFSIRNTATATLPTVVVTVGGADASQFSITTNGCLGALGRNAICMVSVVFKPTTAGDKTATLDIAAGGGRKSATLTGKAISLARVTVLPMDADFGSLTIGSRSEAKPFTIKNEGGMDATGLEVKVAGEMFEAMGAGCTATLKAGESCMQSVIFAPTSVGGKMGTLTVSTGVMGAVPVTIQLTGTGVARPSVVAVPSSVDFDPIGVGRTGAASTVMVRNPGASAVTGFTAGVSSPDFVVGANTCAGMIAPSGTCTVQVSFSPKSMGAKRGELALTVTGGDSVGVPLAGTGVRAAALLISPTAPNFGSVPAAGASSPLTMTVRNDGGEDISSLAVALSGADMAEFQLTNNCGTTLAANATCTVAVVFRPTNEGAATATIRVSGSVAGTGLQPPTVETTLAGTGVRQPTMAIAPTEGGFGTVVVGRTSDPINFTIRNTGGAATGALRVTTTGTEFRIVPGSDACNNVALAAGQSCVLSVVFSPAGAGPRSSPLTVVGEPGGSLSAMLSGVGAVGAQLHVDRTSASFGTVGLGQTSSEVIFTVTNVGDGDSGLVQPSTGSSQFVIGSNGCQNQALTPGESCSLAVRFVAANVGDFSTELRVSATPGGAVTSALTATGAMPASIAFQQADGSNLTVQPLGQRPVGMQSTPIQVFVRNTGQTASGVLTTVIAGTNPGDFGIVADSNTCGTALPPGGQCTMSVFFLPTVGGDRNATINVMAAAGGVASLLLQGRGEGLVQIRHAGTEVTAFNFEEVTTGLFREETFTVRALIDTGTYTVTFDGGGAPPNFVRVADAAAADACENNPQLMAGDDCTIRVRFLPQSLGPKAGRLTVTTSGGISASVALSGTGAGPLQFSPRPHNFGDQPAGSTSEQVFTLVNNGPLAMTAVAVSLTGSSDYVIAADTCATAPPASNATCLVTVRFIPTTPGPKTSTLSATGTFVEAGANQTSTATVALTGNATPAAQITVAPATHDYGAVAVGAAGVTQTFTVANGTGLPTTGGVTFDTSQATADFVVSRDGCVLADNTTRRPLAAGESCTFDVRFTPGATGARAGVVRVFANPGGSVSVRVGGTGLSTLLIEPGAQDLDAGGNLNVVGQTNSAFNFLITNRGAAGVALTTDLKISSVVGATADGPSHFQISPSLTPALVCPATLAGGASCQVRVAMVTPVGATPGRKFARLEAAGMPAATTTAVSELSGTLRADAAISYVDGNAPREFGGIKVNTISGNHLVQVQNTGGVSVGALQVAFLPVPSNFELALTTGTNPDTGNAVCVPGASLAPNTICDIVVRFRPNTALGPLSGTLRVSATGFGAVSGNQDKALSGVGIQVGGIYLSPSPSDFGSAIAGAAAPIERVITVTHETGVPVAVAAGGVTASGAGFTVASDTCSPSIPAGGTCTITARFQPAGGAALGTVTGSLQIVGTPAGGGALTATAAIQGRVVAPALRVEAPSEGANFGEALVGVAATGRIFTVRNTGGASTTTAPVVSVSGAQAADFVIPAGAGNNTCTAVLAPNGTCTVVVVLTPAAIAARNASLDASSGPVNATLALTANAVLPSAVQVVSIGGVAGAATTVNFATKAVGSETGIDVVIRNIDNGQRIAAPTFTLGDSVNFRFDTNAGTANDCFEQAQDGLTGGPPGESCTVRIFFRPQALPAAGTAAPNVTSTLIVGGASTGLTLTLQGNAVSALGIAPGTGAFGSLAVNATSALTTFTITNSNDAGIPATGQVAVSLDGAEAVNFRITLNECVGITLAPGATCQIDVVFEPKSTGAKAATLSVTASPTNGASAPLSGTGT